MTDDPSLTLLHRGKYVDLVQRQGWEFVARKNICGIVAIVAVTDDGKLLLVEQFRPPLNKSVLELPAGLAGDSAENRNEPLENAARRELLEETGYSAARVIRLVEGASSAGITDESVTLFLAQGVRRTAAGGGVGGERITLHEVPLNQVVAFLQEQADLGKTVDMKVYSGLCFAVAPWLLESLPQS